jgi:hypothetical protein
MPNQYDIAVAGKAVDTVPVSISYKIIELFSGHLYSNPAKAIEELVVNSYDAFARHCEVVVPNDWESPDARILVWDDGESMDLDGLKALWLIASTNKRESEYTRRAQQRHRLPIGKFGIGKLASYVIGRRITHICKREKLLAVTMDYSEIVPGEPGSQSTADESRKIQLSVREISEQEARELLGFATSGSLPNGVSLPLFGINAPRTWTLVIVDRLKDAAKRITIGKLRWIISTALPLVPDFQVSLNGDQIPPSRINYKILKKWWVGKNDKVARELGYASGSNPKNEEPFDSWVVVPHVGRVSGELCLYEDTLLGGKAEEVGRSHGFFLMVRRRLINHDDPLLGIHVLSHATFNRLHAVIYADDLDSELVASRENISEESKVALQKYLLAKFNEIRGWYQEQLGARTHEEGLTERLSSVPGQLVRFPIIHAIDRAKHDGEQFVRSIQLPEKGVKTRESIVGLELAPLDPTLPLAIFDSSTGVVKVNTNHPFYVNYYDSSNIEAVATAEILLEAYLLESKLTPPEVLEVVEKRDQLLRALVRDSPRSVTILAQQLRDSVGIPGGMKEACHRSFQALGFEVVVLRGQAEPDGLASAPLPVKYGKELRQIEQGSYKVTYYVESSKQEMSRIAGSELPRIVKQLKKYGARYAAIIAPDFREASTKTDSILSGHDGICFIRIKDFASLIEASGTKPLPLSKIEALFRDSRSPDAAHDWIQRFRSSPDTLPELREILQRAFILQQTNRTDPPSIGAIKYYKKTLAASEREINEWLTSLSRLLPGLIYVFGEKVELHQTPEIIVNQFQRVLQQLSGKRRQEQADA